jgi:exonuclease III
MERLKHYKNNKLTGNSASFSMIPLKVNSLNSSIKRHRLPSWMKKQDPTIFCLQEIHLIGKDKHRL